MKHFSLFILSVATGILLWVISPTLTGQSEPWDSPLGIPYLFVAGFGLGFLGYERPWLWPLGLYLGQFIYGASTFLQPYSGGGANMFFPLGMILLIPYSLVSLVGAVLAAALRKKRS